MKFGVNMLVKCKLITGEAAHKHVGEIDGRRQFQEHFTCSYFCSKIFLYKWLRNVFFWRKEIDAKAALKHVGEIDPRISL